VGGKFQGKGDDFYNSIFYFSGMGSVVGSALAHGVYVSDQNRRNAVDPDDVGGGGVGGGGGRGTGQLVVSARGQAQHLSTDFHRLQGLLEALPVFTGSGAGAVDRGERRPQHELDQPIHGELYFRCKERFPVQPSPTPHQQQQVREPAAFIIITKQEAQLSPKDRVSVELLPVATQQCRNYLYDKS